MQTNIEHAAIATAAAKDLGNKDILAIGYQKGVFLCNDLFSQGVSEGPVDGDSLPL